MKLLRVPGQTGVILLGLALASVAAYLGLGHILPRSCLDPGTTEAVEISYDLHQRLEQKRAEFAASGVEPTLFSEFIELSDLPSDGVLVEGWNFDETELLVDTITSKYLKLYWKEDATVAKFVLSDGVVKFSVRAVFNRGHVHDDFCPFPGECRMDGTLEEDSSPQSE